MCDPPWCTRTRVVGPRSERRLEIANERANAGRRARGLGQVVRRGANARDAEGWAELYEADAVLGFPPGQQTVGRAAIRQVNEQMVSSAPMFTVEEAVPTLRFGDLALTSTRPADNAVGRVQVARRQADGTWLRIIDRPELT